MKPFFVSIPHAGEIIPKEVTWLTHLTEPTLMRDVDRFVDQLYRPALKQLKIPNIVALIHRYVIDLNRLPEEIDQASVVGAPDVAGTHPKGLHWSVTTYNEPLILQPMSSDLHQELVKKYYLPIHQKIREQFLEFKSQGYKKVFHLDAHSMPSKGTSMHKDPGAERADIVVSDQLGKSCDSRFKDLVIKAYENAGFKVAYNWPYIGGGITVLYGKPELGQHTIQVEMNRKLYMNEDTKKIIPEKLIKVQSQITHALTEIYSGLDKLL